MTEFFHLSIDHEGIATVVIDVPGEKVNTFKKALLEQLLDFLDELSARKEIKAVLFISKKKDNFFAGANLKEMLAALKEPAKFEELLQIGRRLIHKMKNLPFPTIALINGSCLGGGLEVAMLCNYRIVTDHPKTVLALSETAIGIHPGVGGTQHLPRLVGLVKGTEMIVASKEITGVEAYEAGLADDISTPEFLEEKGHEFARKILIKKPPLRKKSLLERIPLYRSYVIGRFQKEILKKTRGFYPAPLAALDVIEKSYALPLEEGLKIELDSVRNLVKTNPEIPYNLISIFFGQQELKKKGGYLGELPVVPSISEAAVVGSGTMGDSIALLFAKAHIAALDNSGFENKEFVLEAVPEDLELKQKVYKEIEDVIPKNGVIATNTSSFRVEDLCSKMDHPERFIGMHFFNHMPLVEIVPGPKTSPETIAKTIDLAKKIGKVPLVVKDCLVNRIMQKGTSEIYNLLQEGISIEELDRAYLGFGMPTSITSLIDKDRIKQVQTGKKITPQVALDRILLAMINEATRCLEEKIVTDPFHLDLALIFGARFPPFRGGLLVYADKMGIKNVYESVAGTGSLYIKFQ